MGSARVLAWCCGLETLQSVSSGSPGAPPVYSLTGIVDFYCLISSALGTVVSRVFSFSCFGLEGKSGAYYLIVAGSVTSLLCFHLGSFTFITISYCFICTCSYFKTSWFFLVNAVKKSLEGL